MIRIAVCDDEQCFVEQVSTLLALQAKELACAVDIFTYRSSGQLLYDVEEGAHFDLLFLDIEMPEKDGMALAQSLGRLLPLALTVFVTSHTKYAVKAFELSVFRYIPKSELEVCLPLALKDACQLLGKNSQSVYVIETPRKMQKVPVDDILYIYKQQKYAVIVLDHEELTVRKSLEQVLGELRGPGKDEGFVMVERGYIVNLFHVDKMEENGLFLDNGTVIPVSRRNQKEVRCSLAAFWRARL